ncbi:hypothetical protein EB241_10135 [Erwinia psidii]|uniref:Uncharacterized protein n=1 Tax=Erwinia psidii TaxID=69224 RepID=A0A3N6SIH0_9GAMM|nr:hypothetical protein EB241_10135 [Erwinia psidii]
MFKIISSILFIVLAFCITAWVKPINSLYLWSSSELFDLLRSAQLIKGDYEWGLDPASNIMMIVFVVAIAVILSVLFRTIRKKI